MNIKNTKADKEGRYLLPQANISFKTALYSLLTTYSSLLTTYSPLLTTHNSQLTTHNSQLTTHYSQLTTHYSRQKTCFSLLASFFLVLFLCSCHVYSFKDVSIPPEVKTVKIGFIENKARYIDPQLSPQLTDRLQQKITGQTRLTRTNNDDAHYQISGYVSEDNITTAGISAQQAATNRLTIGVHIIFRNTLTAKTDEFDVTRNFDFSANLSRQQAETQLHEEILKNITDEIFNHIFSNW